MPTGTRRRVKVEPSSPEAPVAAPPKYASDLTPTHVGAGRPDSASRVIELRRCTHQTHQYFGDATEYDLWVLNALYVGIDPLSIYPDEIGSKNLLPEIRAADPRGMDPVVQLFISNLTLTEQAVVNGELSVSVETDSGCVGDSVVTVPEFASLAKRVPLPKPPDADGSYFMSPNLQLGMAASQRFYSYAVYVRGDRSTEPNPKEMRGWIKDELRRRGLPSSDTMTTVVYKVTKDPLTPPGVRPGRSPKR